MLVVTSCASKFSFGHRGGKPRGDWSECTGFRPEREHAELVIELFHGTGISHVADMVGEALFQISGHGELRVRADDVVHQALLNETWTADGNSLSALVQWGDDGDGIKNVLELIDPGRVHDVRSGENVRVEEIIDDVHHGEVVDLVGFDAKPAELTLELLLQQSDCLFRVRRRNGFVAEGRAKVVGHQNGRSGGGADVSAWGSSR